MKRRRQDRENHELKTYQNQLLVVQVSIENASATPSGRCDAQLLAKNPMNHLKAFDRIAPQLRLLIVILLLQYQLRKWNFSAGAMISILKRWKLTRISKKKIVNRLPRYHFRQLKGQHSLSPPDKLCEVKNYDLFTDNPLGTLCGSNNSPPHLKSRFFLSSVFCVTYPPSPPSLTPFSPFKQS